MNITLYLHKQISHWQITNTRTNIVNVLIVITIVLIVYQCSNVAKPCVHQLKAVWSELSGYVMGLLARCFLPIQ